MENLLLDLSRELSGAERISNILGIIGGKNRNPHADMEHDVELQTSSSTECHSVPGSSSFALVLRAVFSQTLSILTIDATVN